MKSKETDKEYQSFDNYQSDESKLSEGLLYTQSDIKNFNPKEDLGYR